MDYKTPKHNTPISTLINNYQNKKSGKIVESRRQMKKLINEFGLEISEMPPMANTYGETGLSYLQDGASNWPDYNEKSNSVSKAPLSF